MTPPTAFAGPDATVQAGEPPTLAVRRQPADPARPVDWIALDEGVDEGLRESGYAVGYAEGRAAAEEEFRQAERQRDAEVERAVRAVSQVVDASRRDVEEQIATFSQALPGLVFAVAEALVGHELAVGDDPGRDALARVLALTPSKEPAVARLHPEDVSRLGDLDAIGDGREITVVADPTVSPGDAVVEIGQSRIESRMAEALDRVRAVLVADGPTGARS